MVEELLYIAPTNGSGGYEIHARGILGELAGRVDVQHVCLPFDGRPVVKTEKMQKILDKTLSTKVSQFCPAIWLTLPTNVQFFPGRSFINMTAWESDRICPQWVMVGRAVDLTLLPTNFLKEVWVNSGVPEEKVDVVHEGTDLSLFNPQVQPLPLFHRGKAIQEIFKYRFLSILQLSNRKNVRGLVLSFMNAFKGRDDACLMLKTSTMDRDLDQFIGDLDLTKSNIFVMDQLLPMDKMPNFMANATHYYSLSCGEGWDLSCVDAGAMGKVIVAPLHSAYTEYLNDDRAYLIKKNKLVPALQGNVLDMYFKGSNWFLPDIEEATEVLKKSISNEEEYKNKAENFCNHVKENLTWEKAVDSLMEIINNKF